MFLSQLFDVVSRLYVYHWGTMNLGQLWKETIRHDRRGRDRERSDWGSERCLWCWKELIIQALLHLSQIISALEVRKGKMSKYSNALHGSVTFIEAELGSSEVETEGLGISNWHLGLKEHVKIYEMKSWIHIHYRCYSYNSSCTVKLLFLTCVILLEIYEFFLTWSWACHCSFLIFN